MTAKPFLKWLGGKSRLIPQLDEFIPEKFTRYFEPFLGGGAVFLHVAQTRKFKEAYLYDISADLIRVWEAVQQEPSELCERLQQLQQSHLELSAENRQEQYYQIRNMLNTYPPKGMSVHNRGAVIIFLNKTCYNGLFRYNRRGEFNSPFGKYEKPSFYDEENIQEVSKLLRRAHLTTGDFTLCERHVTKGSFVYFDPPYRPLSKTSSFTGFSSGGFSDPDQERLAASFKRLDQRGAKLMLSNSDTGDGYFEDLYKGFNIHRVRAGRAVNSNPERRGKINELVITNY